MNAAYLNDLKDRASLAMSTYREVFDAGGAPKEAAWAAYRLISDEAELAAAELAKRARRVVGYQLIHGFSSPYRLILGDADGLPIEHPINERYFLVANSDGHSLRLAWMVSTDDDLSVTPEQAATHAADAGFGAIDLAPYGRANFEGLAFGSPEQ